MYIFKNAWRGIARAKGRNVLIGMIVLIISFSACISLSICAASDTAAEEAAANLKVTAGITVDREEMMGGFEKKEEKQSALSGARQLTLDELEHYAQADSVSEFYYTMSASLDGSSVEPVSTSQNQPQDAGGGPMGDRMESQGEFTVTGYSADAAMTEFMEGSSSITEGAMFEEGQDDGACVIHTELAAYNDLAVGDKITLANPNEEDETYTLTVCGIYDREGTGDAAAGMLGSFMTGADSSNQIYTSYQTLDQLLSSSREGETEVRSMLNGTYSFDTVEDYESFQEEVRTLGLSDEYTVSSDNLNAYEESLEPLRNLSRYAGYFLVVILAIGSAILVVLHIFSIRERKYEIGVLAAIGMKKRKIAAQFLTETLLVTFCALIIGAAAGGVSSVPVTNKLLEQQVENSMESGQRQRFGRETGEMQSPPGEERMDSIPGEGQADGNAPQVFQKASGYISSISSAMDIAVVVKMIGIGIVLTLLSGCAALIFVMRYDPLRILYSRD